MRAIFAVDPGGSTGVAWGVFNDKADTVVDAMSNRELSGSTTIHLHRIEGSTPAAIIANIRNQTAEVSKLWSRFLLDLPQGAMQIDFVLEHFVLTSAPHHKPGVEGIFPAFLVGSILWEVSPEPVILQTAGKGMKWNKRPHLERYDAWIIGKEHERAAFAHIAARLHDVLT